MTTSPSLVPDTPDAGPLHFVLCDFGGFGRAIVEPAPEGDYDAPRATFTVLNLSRGYLERESPK